MRWEIDKHGDRRRRVSHKIVYSSAAARRTWTLLTKCDGKLYWRKKIEQLWNEGSGQRTFDLVRKDTPSLRAVCTLDPIKGHPYFIVTLVC